MSRQEFLERQIQEQVNLRRQMDSNQPPRKNKSNGQYINLDSLKLPTIQDTAPIQSRGLSVVQKSRLQAEKLRNMENRSKNPLQKLQV